jgi:hypothetical protein
MPWKGDPINANELFEEGMYLSALGAATWVVYFIGKRLAPEAARNNASSGAMVVIRWAVFPLGLILVAAATLGQN